MTNSKHSLFLITSRKGFRAEADRAVAELPGAGISGMGTPSEAVEATRSGSTTILLDLDSGRAEGLKALRKLNDLTPEVRVIATSVNRDPELILEAVRAGANDFLVTPLERQALADALGRAIRRPGGEGGGTPAGGRVISFLSVKGGCGATTLAVNLAADLCNHPPRKGFSVILLDLDQPGGDATAMLNLKPAYNLADVAANLHRLDMDLLRSMAMRHKSGLEHLAAAGDGVPPGWLDSGKIGGIVEFLRNHYDLLVLAGGGAGEKEMTWLQQAEIVHLVTTVDFLAVKRAQGMVKRLRELGLPGENLRIVANRNDRGSGLGIRDAREALGIPVVWTLPDDPRTALQAVNEGIPFVSRGRSRLTKAVREYASRLVPTNGKPAARNGLGGLFRKRSANGASGSAGS